MFKNVFYKLFIFSGIIPSTILLLLGIFVIFISFEDLTFNLKGIFISLCFILAFLGYIGLWQILLFQKQKITKNQIYLWAGIIGYISFFVIEGGQTAWNWLINFEEPFEILLFFWPVIVITICLLKTYLKNKNYNGNLISKK